MKALSLWQPWASLMVAGLKAYETRSWRTGYRGPLLIHAAKRIDTDISFALRVFCKLQWGKDWHLKLPTGVILGRCTLDDCLLMTNELIRTIKPREYTAGNWTPGRYAWKTTDMYEFPNPIQWRGRQGLFDVPDAVVEG